MTQYDDLLNGLSNEEKRQIVKRLQVSKKPRKFIHNFSGKYLRFGYFSDSHIGSVSFSEKLWMKMCAYFKREKINTVYCPGDIIEGMSGRDGHIYELTHIGATAQTNYASQLLNEAKFDIYAITGNHDLWFMNKGNAGLNIGETLDSMCDNFHFLGDWEADVVLAPKVIMKIIHCNDATAYADSYKIQKLIESFSGGKKPNIVLSGHYHKQIAIFRRNVFGFECGTLCGQTQWMRGKKIQAHMGFGIIEIWICKNGIERLRHEFFPEYEVDR